MGVLFDLNPTRTRERLLPACPGPSGRQLAYDQLRSGLGHDGTVVSQSYLQLGTAYFQDKGIKTARAMFKEKERDRVDCEFRVWKGEVLFLIMSACLSA